MRQKERARAVFDRLRSARPVVKTELEYGSPFQLTVAVVLSAQCTDKRVNMTTPRLFGRYPDAAAMKAADEEELFGIISAITYPRSKARHLIALSRMLDEEFGGVLPDTLAGLQRLPGVGRKTANVLLSVLFDRNTIAVDTHVYRVSRRIGLVPLTANTPLKVEQKLLAVVPPEHLPDAHHRLLLHGRYLCTARKPLCGECPLRELCRHYALRMRAESKKEKIPQSL